MSYEERINLVIAAQNKTKRELDKIIGDLGRLDKKSKDVSKSQRAFGRASSAASREASGAMTNLSSKAGALGRVLGTLGPLGIGAAGGISAIGTAVFKGTMSFAEWDKRMRRTQALIKATGSAAGLSASQLDRLAKQRDLSTLGDRNEIMDAINVLLTFKSIQKETFEDTLGIAQDMSATFGQSLRSSVTMLGKALEDPARGLTALRRVGVSFTEEEKELIEAMLRANDAAGAQAQILAVLQKQVGGAAESEAGGLSGKLDTLNFRWREFLESVEQTRTFGTVVDKLSESFHDLSMNIKSVRDQKSLSDQLDILDWKIQGQKDRIAQQKSPQYQDDMLSDSFGYHIHKPIAEELAELRKLEKERAALLNKLEHPPSTKTSTGGTTTGHSSTTRSGSTKNSTGTATTANTQLKTQQERALASLRSDIARLTMTGKEFSEFKLNERAKELGKLLGDTNPELQKYLNLQREKLAQDNETPSIQSSSELSHWAQRAGTDQSQKYMDAWTKGIDSMEQPLNDKGATLQELAANIGNSTGSAMGNMFYSMFTGKLDSIGDYVSSWGQSVLRYVSNILGQQTGSALMSGFTGFVKNSFFTPNANAQFSALRGAGLTGYATGGISYGPQVALVSEGRYPAEAHVPLPDGRRIPVSLSVDHAGQSSQPQRLEVQIHNESSQPLQVKNATLAQDPVRQVMHLFLEGCSQNIGGVGEHLGLTGY